MYSLWILGFLLAPAFVDSAPRQDALNLRRGRIPPGTPEEGFVRLVGGSAPNMGRVEVYHNGQWGSICDDLFRSSDAKVICAQLGYDPMGSTFIPFDVRRTLSLEGTGPIWLDDLECNATLHTNISQCDHSGWGAHNCIHIEDAAVNCSIKLPPPPSGRTDIRLVGGSVPSEGRVEVLHDRGNGYGPEWGTICDDWFGQTDATVVCRMLGYSSVGAVAFKNSHFGPAARNLPIWLDDLRCASTEATLAECAHTGWGKHNCNHEEDASVSCRVMDDPMNVRLVGGETPAQGRLEVSVAEGHWGTVCDDEFNNKSAAVICRMLGYPDAGAQAMGGGYFGEGRGNILLDDVICNGTEASLDECQHPGIGIHNCGHSEDVGVACQSDFEAPEMRLRLSSSLAGVCSYDGRVEVYHRGRWGTICVTNNTNPHSIKAADLICNQLFPGAYQIGAPTARIIGGNVARKSQLYGPLNSADPVWLSQIRCPDGATALHQCLHRQWGSHPQCMPEDNLYVNCFSDLHAQDCNVPGLDAQADAGSGEAEANAQGEAGEQNAQLVDPAFL